MCPWHWRLALKTMMTPEFHYGHFRWRPTFYSTICYRNHTSSSYAMFTIASSVSKWGLVNPLEPENVHSLDVCRGMCLPSRSFAIVRWFVRSPLRSFRLSSAERGNEKWTWRELRTLSNANEKEEDLQLVVGTWHSFLLTRAPLALFLSSLPRPLASIHTG